MKLAGVNVAAADPGAPPIRARTVAGIAGIVAILILLAKSFGFVREIVIAGAFGAGWERDAYNLAYQIPAYALILLGGLNGPFHSATLAALTRLKESGREIKGSPVLTIMLLTGAVMASVAALVYVFAAPIVMLQGPWAAAQTQALATSQLRYMVPVLLVGAWIGVLCGVSTHHGRFALPTLSPAVSSLAIIGFVLWRPDDPLMLAVGTTVGAILQLLLQGFPAMWAAGPRALAIRPCSPADPAIREAGALLWPAVLASTIGQVNVFVGTFFLSKAGEGAIAAWGYANIVYQLPLGTLLAALLVPLFPRLTAAAARDDRAALFNHLNRGVQLVGLVAIPLAVGVAVAAVPLVRVAFERGRFAETGGTALTAPVLAILCTGMIGYALRDLFVRVFYAVNDAQTPMRVMLVSLALNVVLNALFMFYFKLGLQGIAWSTVIVTWLNFGQIAWALRAKLGTLGLGPSWPILVRALGAALCAGGVMIYLMRIRWPGGFLGGVLELAAVGAGGAATYGGVLLALRVGRILKGQEAIGGTPRE
ncbi:MAG: murein biosynthesis integral membrane protein MurJ [Candidatus Sericytochromatia bacterium]|nr:murein biosynthesis integral membrane protein MurJ [Candidatus Tanganyikabacteria bacterium]